MGQERKASAFLVDQVATGNKKRKWADNIKMHLGQNRMVWTGLIWLSIGTSGEDL
jgi:hypothetical protein